jgi:hypothetical protein
MIPVPTTLAVSGSGSVSEILPSARGSLCRNTDLRLIYGRACRVRTCRYRTLARFTVRGAQNTPALEMPT